MYRQRYRPNVVSSPDPNPLPGAAVQGVEYHRVLGTQQTPEGAHLLPGPHSQGGHGGERGGQGGGGEDTYHVSRPL